MSNTKTTHSRAPIIYCRAWLKSIDPALALDRLWNELGWVQHEGVPRREYYVNRLADPKPYTYGSGRGIRTYQPQPMHDLIDMVWGAAEEAAGCEFDVCFLNGYRDSRDQLGWHSDDSPEMDDARPIAIVTLGAEREIWFRPIPPARVIRSIDPTAPEPEKLLLHSGSICLMRPGMQDTHQHRIPKAGHITGPRVSFTFRGIAA